MRLHIPILACLTLCLAGCSDRYATGDADPQSRAVPVPSSASPTPTNLLAPSDVPAPAASSDPVMKSGDTLSSNSHALDSGDPVAASDPVSQSRDLSSTDDPLSGRRLEERKIGWYWLRGTTENGHIRISFNGAPCGDFSDFTDREVTRFVVPGMNQVSFTSIPTSRTRPMTAHLILYMRPASAQVHHNVAAITYDLLPPDQGPDTPKQPSLPESDPHPVVMAPALPKIAAPQTRVMTFFAK